MPTTMEQTTASEIQEVHTPQPEDIAAMTSVEEIETLQKTLSSNYKVLAKDFSQSRLARVEAYIAKIEELQQQLKKAKASYESALEASVPQLNQDTGAEQSTLEKNKSIKRKRFDPHAAVTPGSPPPPTPASPDLDPLPIFTDCFDEVLEPYRKSLDAVKRQYEYSSQLIESQTDRNCGIVWRQSIKDRQEARHTLRQKTVHQLEELQDDYNNVSKNKKVRYQEMRYRASTRKAGDKKAKSDNVIIDEEVKTRSHEFFKNASTDAHQLYSKGTPLSQASQSEIDKDLSVIRSGVPSSVRVEKIEANYLYQEQPLKKGAMGPTTMTDLVNSEIEANGVAAIQFQVNQGQYPPPMYQQRYQPPPPQHQQALPPQPSPHQQHQHQQPPQQQPQQPQFQQMYGPPQQQFQPPPYQNGQMPMMYNQMVMMPLQTPGLPNLGSFRK